MLHLLHMTVEKTTSETHALRLAIENVHQDLVRMRTAKYRLPRELANGVVRGFGIAIGGTIVFSIVIFILSQLGWKTWLENSGILPEEIHVNVDAQH